jgi:hypothetical protein
MLGSKMKKQQLEEHHNWEFTDGTPQRPQPSRRRVTKDTRADDQWEENALNDITLPVESPSKIVGCNILESKILNHLNSKDEGTLNSRLKLPAEWKVSDSIVEFLCRSSHRPEYRFIGRSAATSSFSNPRIRYL